MLNQAFATGSLWFTSKQRILLGWSTVFRWRDLHAVGGWTRAAGALTEDAPLGRLFAKHNLPARLHDGSGALTVDASRLTLRTFVEQQWRWRIHMRATAPRVQIAIALTSPFTMPVLTALVASLASRSVLSLGILASAYAVSATTRGASLRDLPALLVAEALFGLGVLWGSVGRRAAWGPWIYTVDARANIVTKTWRG